MSTVIRTTPLRERMRAELQLAGLSERTQEAYLRAVRQLAEHSGRPPDQLTEAELRSYFLYVKNEKRWAAASLASASSIGTSPRAIGPSSSASRSPAPTRYPTS